MARYVMQEDVMNAFLTVRETIGLAAAFQLPPEVSDADRAALVTAVIGELGLSKVRGGGDAVTRRRNHRCNHPVTHRHARDSTAVVLLSHVCRCGVACVHHAA